MHHEPSELRDYFAARAPEIPDWFQPNMDHLPRVPEEPDSLPVVDLDNLDPDNRHAVWEKEKARVKRIQAEYRFIYWRWYYADLMVSHRAMITDVPII